MRRATAAPRFGTLRFEAGIFFPSPRNYMNFGSEIDAWGLKMEVRESTLGPQGDVEKKREKHEVPRAHFWELFSWFWVLFWRPNLMKNNVFSEPWFFHKKSWIFAGCTHSAAFSWFLRDQGRFGRSPEPAKIEKSAPGSITNALLKNKWTIIKNYENLRNADLNIFLRLSRVNRCWQFENQ